MAGATGSPKCKLCGVPHRIGAPHDRAGLRAPPVVTAIERVKTGFAGRTKATKPIPKKRPPGAALAPASTPKPPAPVPAGVSEKLQDVTA